MVETGVNRGRQFALAGAVAAAACIASPSLARDKGEPSLSIDPIVARNLLAPVEEAGPSSARGYRLDPGLDPAGGQRAKLSVDLGGATMFAITGRLQRQALPSGPLDPGDARTLGHRRDTGKVYGAGVSGSVRGVDLSATYQYSKLRPDTGSQDFGFDDDGPGKSHSLRATARIRFRR